MNQDLFFDAWQTNESSHQVHQGPLVPSTHPIRDTKKLLFLKLEVSRLWKLEGVRVYNPAPNPVSIEKRDLSLLSKNNYVAAEKTDGVRYLLLLTMYPRALGGYPVAVMSNRKHDMYEIRVMAEESFFLGTLFDGELVWEQNSGSAGKCIPPRQVYLAFDLVAINGRSCTQENLLKRFNYLASVLDYGNKDIAQDPRRWLEHAQQLCEEHKIVCEGNQYCLTFRAKTMMPKQQLDTLWRNRHELKHKSDGLIFTPVDEPIQTGTHQTMFKWKSHHTVDLQWSGYFSPSTKLWSYTLEYGDGNKMCRGDVEGVLVKRTLDSDCKEELPLVFIPNEYCNQLLQWHQKRGDRQFTHLIECTCKLPSDDEWCQDELPLVEVQIMKIRHDKSTPNQKKTIERTLNNIQENISIRDLLEVCK